MVNMTPDFYNFFRNALEILGLKSWGLLTLCVFTVDVASVGRFPIDSAFALRVRHKKSTSTLKSLHG